MSFVSLLSNTQAITQYPELIDYVRKVLDRGTEFDDYYDEWLRLTETALNRELRVPDMEAFRTEAVTGETLAVAPDFLSLRSVFLTGQIAQPLQIMTLHGLIEQFGRRSGEPQAVALEGNTFRFAPVGDTEINYTYYKRIPNLSLDVPVNWLLTKHPDVYVYGMLLHAETVIDEPRLINQWKAAFDEAKAQIVIDGNRNRWAGPMNSTGGWGPVNGIRC